MGSTHVVEPLLFSIVPSILTFDVELIFGSFLLFGAIMGYYSGRSRVGKLSTHVAEQLLFSIVPSILTFDFDLILRSFLTFWGPMGFFWGQGRVQNLFWSLLT